MKKTVGPDYSGRTQCDFEPRVVKSELTQGHSCRNIDVTDVGL